MIASHMLLVFVLLWDSVILANRHISLSSSLTISFQQQLAPIIYTNNLHQWSAKFSLFWHCFYVRGWHHHLLHWGHCRQRCYFTKQSFIWTEQVVPRKLSNSPLGKLRSNVIDEKTVHWATKFSDYWWGSDRVGQTQSLFWRHHWWQAFLVKHLTDVKKSFVNKLNLLKRGSFLSRDAQLDLYFQVILPSVLYGLVVWGGCFNMKQLNS